KDGNFVISGTDEGSINVWDALSATLKATLVSMPNSDDWLVATPDGLFDGSPESWNLMLWRFDGSTFNVLPVESFFNEFYYPGVLADILSNKNPTAPSDIVQKDRRQPRINLKIGNGTPNANSRNIDVELEVTAAPPRGNQLTDSGAKDLRLFRNGLLVKVWSGDVLHKSNARTVRTTIQIVAGENRISAYAFNNDNIKSLDATAIVNGADTLKRQGAAHLLVIGIEQYENPRYNLKYPVADATQMGAQLKAQQERLGRYNPIVTIPLTNAEATKKNILLALGRLAGSHTGPLPQDAPKILSTINPAQPEDAVVIYFSGHGTALKDRFYLIPHDMGYKGSQLVRDMAGFSTIINHSISDEELVSALQPLDADQLLVVIDACNSGQALESDEKRRGPMNTKGLAQLAYEKGIYVLTASQSMEVAFEADALKHSYLAYALLEEGLKNRAADGNRDGDIFLKEWFDYANHRVPEIRRRRQERRKELVEDEPDEQKVQRPRVFYTREIGARRLLIARHSN
ncbi:MAG TPA: caspase family protein, partial [Pyrinomonadaceae bacterium]|nr:caspase family protein [Pyrinomonadaceae bacterium]